MPGSAFSINTNPKLSSSSIDLCPSAKAQLDLLLKTLTEQGIAFRTKAYNYLDKSYRYNPFNRTTVHGSPIPILQTLYLNIEDKTPSYYFTSNTGKNLLFVKEFVDYAMGKGIEIGFYTTKQDWLNIMSSITTYNHQNSHNNDYFYDYQLPVHTSNMIPLSNLLNPFRQLKLWIPRFDSTFSMLFYSSFGDWDRPYMKQLKGSTTDLRRIGTDRVCVDYVENS
jgi:hypothetical protein